MDGSNGRTRWILLLNVGCLIAAAFWLRTFSLASLPEHHSDESYYGLQTHRMLHGQTFLSHTTSRNIVSPLLVLTQVPFDLLFGPSIYTLRLPVVLAGLAAAGLLFFIGRRALDERTAAIAALGVLALPPAIQFSRFGCEYGQTPFVVVVALGLLWARRPLSLLGWLAFAPLTHPTNLLILPFVFPLTWVTAREQTDGRARRRWWLLSGGLVAIGLVGLILLRSNPNVAGHATASRSPLAFLDGFAQFFIGWEQAARPSSSFTTYRCILAAALAALMLAGLPRLIRGGERTRLAILAGWIAMLAAFDLVAGSNVLADPILRRYGAVLIVPTVLSLAILLESSFRPLLSAPRAPHRIGAWVAPVAAGWLLILASVQFVFGPYLAGTHRLTAYVSADPFEEAANAVVSRLPADPDRRGKATVVTQDLYINGLQTEYLLSNRPDVVVKPLMTLLEVWKFRTDPTGVALQERRARLAQLLDDGAFAVAIPSSSAERGHGIIEAVVAETLAADDIDRWEAANQVVYRRKAVPEEPIYRVPGTALRPGDEPILR